MIKKIYLFSQNLIYINITYLNNYIFEFQSSNINITQKSHFKTMKTF